jgi:hypothetical protein
MTKVSPDRYLYVFLDEAGNFDFSPNGTKFFLLGCISKERPFMAGHELNELKYDLVEKGIGIEFFHAAEDQQATRNEVFNIICKNLNGVRYDSVIVEKCKTGPALQVPEKFWPKMLGYLLKYVLEQHDLSVYKEVIVFTDQIPIQRKRKAVEKTIKATLASMLPSSARYRIYHHDSKSNFDLQIADYFNWAVYRKWDRSDLRSYSLINSVVESEFDIFRSGGRKYY